MYRYSLDKKSKKFYCPNCNKKRFVRYVDNETNEYLNSKVGRCDREINCGYHYKPKQYFKDNRMAYIPLFNKKIQVTVSKPSFHDIATFKTSLNDYHKNNFVIFLYKTFNKNAVDKMIDSYKIGTANFWYFGTIFWQIDSHNNVRGGKIIKYKNNGKRTKYINWVHSYLIKKNKIKSFNLAQCFFGEHLINENNKIIAIVESEKTACIMSIIFDKYLWIAAGSLSGINSKKMNILQNRKIVLYPDLGVNINGKTPYNIWKKKCFYLKNKGFDISISNLLELKGNDIQREKGFDIADYFVLKNQCKNIL